MFVTLSGVTSHISYIISTSSYLTILISVLTSRDPHPPYWHGVGMLVYSNTPLNVKHWVWAAWLGADRRLGVEGGVRGFRQRPGRERGRDPVAVFCLQFFDPSDLSKLSHILETSMNDRDSKAARGWHHLTTFISL